MLGVINSGLMLKSMLPLTADVVAILQSMHNSAIIHPPKVVQSWDQEEADEKKLEIILQF